MNAFGLKQPVLKPQDLVVVLKLAGMQNAEQTFAALARDLLMSASEVHAAVQRCVASHLLDRSDGTFGVNRVSLREFLLHGVRYAFPIVAGPVMRGMPTGVSAPPLDAFFEHADLLPVVWPDPEGAVRGIAICPLYPSVPGACKLDPILYRLLALVDALRGGAARERELAEQLLIDSIQ